MALYIHKGPRLWLTADKERVVEDGDPAAAFLLVGEGGQLSEEDARKYGLMDEEKTKRVMSPNKAKAAPAENKADVSAEEEIIFDPDPAFETRLMQPEPKKGKR